MSELIEVINAQGPVAEVRLNRPAKKNAITLDLLDDLVAACAGLAVQPGPRVVLVRGAGGDFSAGLDTSAFMEMAGALDRVKDDYLTPAPGQIANRFQRPAQVIQALPVPVIAVLEGVCFGAGLQLALAADFRIAAPDARLSIMEAKWGLIPDMGISLSLPRLMPSDRAKALILTAEVISGEAALREGLVTRVEADPWTAAQGFAEDLARRSPEAVRSGKALVDALWGRDPAPDLALEARLQRDIIGSPNQVETVMAQLQKRAPNYR